MKKNFAKLLLLFSFTLFIPLIAFTQNQKSVFGNELVDAADDGNLMRVVELIRSGIQVDSKGNFGTTSLMRASIKNHRDLVQLLLDIGADVNAKDSGGATALQLSAREGNIDIVKLLIKDGSKIDQADNEGWTALMKATQNQKVLVADYLLEKGANPKLANKFGHDSYYYAFHNDNPEVARAFLNRANYANLPEHDRHHIKHLADNSKHEELKKHISAHTPSEPTPLEQLASTPTQPETDPTHSESLFENFWHKVTTPETSPEAIVELESATHSHGDHKHHEMHFDSNNEHHHHEIKMSQPHNIDDTENIDLSMTSEYEMNVDKPAQITGGLADFFANLKRTFKADEGLSEEKTTLTAETVTVSDLIDHSKKAEHETHQSHTIQHSEPKNIETAHTESERPIMAQKKANELNPYDEKPKHMNVSEAIRMPITRHDDSVIYPDTTSTEAKYHNHCRKHLNASLKDATPSDRVRSIILKVSKPGNPIIKTIKYSFKKTIFRPTTDNINDLCDNLTTREKEFVIKGIIVNID